jgi:WD40 repeat protein
MKIFRSFWTTILLLCLGQMLIAQDGLGSANPNVYVSPDERLVLMDGYNAWIYDTEFRLIDSFHVIDETRTGIYRMNTAWNRDGSRFAISIIGINRLTQERREILEIWDFHSRARIATVSDILGGASIAWSPDGTRVATIHQADRFHYSVRIYDLNGTLQYEWLLNERISIYYLVWLTNDQIAVTTDGDEEKPAGVKIIDSATGTVVGNIPDANVFLRPDYNAQLKLLAVPKKSDLYKIGLWMLNPLQEVFTFEGTGSVDKLNWHENKLAGAGDNAVQLWQLSSRQPISTIETGSFLIYPCL